jgi:group II intron reverse transcriptase/maturase
MLKAVAAHTKERWVLLYVERWLKAPLDKGDENLQARDRGTPQGSAISPVLANLYLHYAFDAWMAREFPTIPFERYADDVVVHCKSERQARLVLGEIQSRMAACHLELNQDKTHIVYCKDSNRHGSHEHERFDFLGYTFRPRSARNGQGELFTSFTPAVGDGAAKEIRRAIRRWRIHSRSETTLTDIAREFNPIVRGWINYYGRFYPAELAQALRRIDEYLMRWAMQKFKRLKGRSMRAWRLLADVFAREPGLFAHWQVVRADGRMVGAG